MVQIAKIRAIADGTMMAIRISFFLERARWREALTSSLIVCSVWWPGETVDNFEEPLARLAEWLGVEVRLTGWLGVEVRLAEWLVERRDVVLPSGRFETKVEREILSRLGLPNCGMVVFCTCTPSCFYFITKLLI